MEKAITISELTVMNFTDVIGQKLLLGKTILVALSSFSLFALAGISSIKTFTENRRLEIPCATNRACENINFTSSDRNVHISAGRIHLGNKIISSKAQTLAVPPCPSMQVENEKFNLFSATDSHPYFSRVPVACLAGGAKGGGPVGFLIEPNSLIIEDQSGHKLIADKDYHLDLRFDSIERLKGSSVPEGALVNLSYSVLRKRMDTISVDKHGIFKLTMGRLSQFASAPNSVPAEEIPIAHINASNQHKAIELQNIMPISGIIPSHTTVEDLCTNAMNLSATRFKLSKHKKLNLLMCGDSVCCGAFSSDIEHSYPALFQKQLSSKSGSEIELTKVAVGGKTSTILLPKILTALTIKHPDLMVIEFVNDLSLSSEQLKNNYAQIFNAARASGTEVIVCLPHLPSPLFYGQPWEEIARKPFYQIIPSLARKHNCVVADVAFRWLHINEEGLQPIDLLTDQANHPNDYGHAIYAQELLKTVLPDN